MILLKVLRKYNVNKIYISQDGYSGDNHLIIKRHNKVKKIIKRFGNKKKFKTNFFKKNLGKQIAPPKGIDWFFKNVDKGVILEDDTISSKTFLTFMKNY